MNDLLKYGIVRVASVAPEIKPGDVDFNIDKILSIMRIVKSNQCNLVVFPELCITGYTIADIFYQDLITRKAEDGVKRIAELSGELQITVFVGVPISFRGRLFNCALCISDGKVCGIIPKTFLPNTKEYYEERWFSNSADSNCDYIDFAGQNVAFGTDLLFSVKNLQNCIIGAEVCEDLWAVIPPSSSMALAGANVLVNLSASDEYLGKLEYRYQLVASQSAKCIAAYIYSACGPGESSTDLVFSGHCLIAENGVVKSESERFKFNTEIIYSDIDIEKLISERLKNNTFAAQKPLQSYRIIEIQFDELQSETYLADIDKMPFVPYDKTLRAKVCREIFLIQTTALAKRLQAINAHDCVLGLSGGLDSTLALLVIVKTFELLKWSKKGIHIITMPGFGTTHRTKSNAERLTELLELEIKEISINNAVNQHFKDISHNPDNHDVVYENSQARERTQILMDISNQVNGIVIGTGDLSELALGWSTYNGDHISMYGVNCGIPKTLVKYIVEWCSENEFSIEIGEVLKDICATPISPELLPAGKNDEILQQTEENVGPYILNDFFLYYFVRFSFKPKKILFLAEHAFKDDFTYDDLANQLKLFLKRFFNSQFKRSCIPDGPKVGTVALSPRGDWRMPSDIQCKMWLENFDI